MTADQKPHRAGKFSVKASEDATWTPEYSACIGTHSKVGLAAGGGSVLRGLVSEDMGIVWAEGSA